MSGRYLRPEDQRTHAPDLQGARRVYVPISQGGKPGDSQDAEKTLQKGTAAVEWGKLVPDEFLGLVPSNKA